MNVHTPGVGVGGHCIAVDPWFIHEKFEDITPLIYEARLVNDGKPAWTADRIARDVKPGAKIAVLGMSFKANIDDTRESPSVLFHATILLSGIFDSSLSGSQTCDRHTEGRAADVVQTDIVASIIY